MCLKSVCSIICAYLIAAPFAAAQEVSEGLRIGNDKVEFAVSKKNGAILYGVRVDPARQIALTQCSEKYVFENEKAEVTTVEAEDKIVAETEKHFVLSCANPNLSPLGIRVKQREDSHFFSGHRRVREVEHELQKSRVELDESDQNRASEPARINQLQYLVEEGYERPDFSRELLMDLLKVCGHNARRQGEEMLKKYYPDRRDHVTLLRRMINAGGHVKLDK